MGLITAVVYLLTFYGLAGAAPTDVTSKLTTRRKSAETITWASWKQKNDPNIALDTLQMIRRAGYPAEAHVITTDDDYLLTLHRIPGRYDSLPVLLQHGLLGSSADWVLLDRGKALAYLLADQGYDVWLGNFRGNTYSRAHISLSPSNSTFWNFSFNEMGIHDLPAMITFITNKRSQLLDMYIGHSMGTTAFYIMASERPKIAQIVRKMISFAPIAFINHMKTPVMKYLSNKSFIKLFKLIMQFTHNELLPQNDFLRFLSKHGCDQNVIEESICVKVMFLLCGYDIEQFNFTLLPVILNHDPAGTSAKTLMHYVQEYKSGKFRKYDYGLAKNLLIYNSTEPPDYNLANINVPIALFYSSGDWLNNIVDVKKLYRILPNVMDMYEVPWPKFNHMDFIWAKDAPKLVYERVLELMKGENPNNNTLIRDNII